MHVQDNSKDEQVRLSLERRSVLCNLYSWTCSYLTCKSWRASLGSETSAEIAVSSMNWYQV